MDIASFATFTSSTSSCPALTGASLQIFLTLINTLTNTQCYFNPKADLPSDCGPTIKNGDVFDFIIIGGGTAGAVVANRLSEKNNWKILLIEAGGYPTSDTEIPNLATTIIGTQQDWTYFSEPSSGSCLGFKDQKCIISSGKVLGGSSSINYMLYHRGNSRDYDNWEELGSRGWCYKNVFPYFLKSENTQSPALRGSPEHGINGYLYTSEAEELSQYPILTQASAEMGLPVGNREGAIGVAQHLLTSINGTRCSTAKAFLGSIRTRSNLCIALNSHVTKIVFNGKIAVGVEFKYKQTTITVKTTKEVILSAGAINSPQILMLSGIGPKSHLQSLNIPVIEDLPVGLNLQDHFAGFGIMLKLKEKAGIRNVPFGTFKDLIQYFTERTGVLSTTTLNLITSCNTDITKIFPNFHIWYLNYIKNDNWKLPVCTSAVRLNDQTKNSWIQINKNQWLLNMAAILLNPKSRGSVTLKSTNSLDQPRLNFNYLSDPQDLQQFLDIIAWIRKFMKTPAMKELEAEFLDYDIPNCKNKVFDSDAYWECNLRNIGTSIFNPVGTCKMGASTDVTAVVDNHLKVFGIRNLRVIDSSIMPQIVSTVSGAPTIMIAEKGADFIKNSYACCH